MKILVTYRAIDNTAGGVERASSLIMNEMVNRGHEIAFVTFDHPGATSFYKLNPGIIWHKLGLGDPSKTARFKMRLQRILAIRKIIKQFKPDVALAFQEASFLSTRLAAIGLSVPVIAAERNSPSRFNFMNLAKRNLAFQSFRFARFITIQCESFRRHYPHRLHSKIETIPNPVFPVETSSEEKENIVLSVGRFEYQKNFQCLIKAFSKISSKSPEWKLVIVGDGQDRKELKDLIEDHNLQNRISLPDPSNDPSHYYKAAKIFCLPSRWEGFPNALGEALAHGLPSVGFGDCDGVRDLIQNNKNGLLATGNDDADSLAGMLRILISDEKLRDEMAKNAIISIQAYEPSSILTRWESLLKQAAGE